MLKAWRGSLENLASGQNELIKRARSNGLASIGQYQGGDHGAAGGESLFVANHKY